MIQDGTVRLWNYRTGKQLHLFDCNELLGIQGSCQDLSNPPSQTSDDCKDENKGEDNGTKTQKEEEESEERLDVKCLSSHQNLKLIAVSFDGCVTIYIS